MTLTFSLLKASSFPVLKLSDQRIEDSIQVSLALRNLPLTRMKYIFAAPSIAQDVAVDGSRRKDLMSWRELENGKSSRDRVSRRSYERFFKKQEVGVRESRTFKSPAISPSMYKNVPASDFVLSSTVHSPSIAIPLLNNMRSQEIIAVAPLGFGSLQCKSWDLESFRSRIRSEALREIRGCSPQRP